MTCIVYVVHAAALQVDGVMASCVYVVLAAALQVGGVLASTGIACMGERTKLFPTKLCVCGTYYSHPGERCCDMCVCGTYYSPPDGMVS